MFDRKQYERQVRKMRKNKGLYHRPKGACGKVQYSTKIEALGVAGTRTKDAGYLRAYECPTCGEYHLTGTRKKF